ncbi:MAG: hypothetical protein ACRDYA_21545, partial [Egibacteraceae bacterium]
IYELRGTWAEGTYHFVMFAFLAQDTAVVPNGFTGHHVTAVRQVRPEELLPHPTVMQILNDAGVADYPQAEIDVALACGGIMATRHLTGVSALVGGKVG